MGQALRSLWAEALQELVLTEEPQRLLVRPPEEVTHALALQALAVMRRPSGSARCIATLHCRVRYHLVQRLNSHHVLDRLSYLTLIPATKPWFQPPETCSSYLALP